VVQAPSAHLLNSSLVLEFLPCTTIELIKAQGETPSHVQWLGNRLLIPSAVKLAQDESEMEEEARSEAEA